MHVKIFHLLSCLHVSLQRTRVLEMLKNNTIEEIGLVPTNPDTQEMISIHMQHGTSGNRHVEHDYNWNIPVNSCFTLHILRTNAYIFQSLVTDLLSIASPLNILPNSKTNTLHIPTMLIRYDVSWVTRVFNDCGKNGANNVWTTIVSYHPFFSLYLFWLYIWSQVKL